ncbi:MAG: antibiotic biosynthesis monooxygenase [Planctomycetes bacterium]|nr:antibiotic biosynthesis monooxygenase [Planctomycetota bacterium]
MSRRHLVARLLSTVTALLGSACHVGYGFRGPGYDADDGTVRADVPETVVVAITAGEIESGGGSRFFAALDEVMNELTARDGLVGYAVRKQTFGGRIWTMSAWLDERSLDAFLASPAHRRAAREGGVPPRSLRYVRTRLPASALPLDWDAAIALLPRADPGGQVRP